MAAKYWIKLYHEILHDPKMVRLRDRLWRRTIECFLLAGDQGRDGLLPCTDDIAFTFRCDPEQLETELVELASLGIVSQVGGHWKVTNFSSRQDAMSKAEYMSRLRGERQKEEYYQDSYQPVTKGNADKNRIESEENRKEPQSAYEHIPESITGLINALAQHTTADVLLDSDMLRQVAEALHEDGAAVDEIAGFPTFWDREGRKAKAAGKDYPYLGRPALKTLRRHWPDYMADGKPDESWLEGIPTHFGGDHATD